MRKTARNVTIVVPVLITNCHVSSNPNTGPLAAQITIIPADAANFARSPAALATAIGMRVKKLCLLLLAIAFTSSADCECLSRRLSYVKVADLTLGEPGFILAAWRLQ
jgi:hypothetical protein